MGTFGSILASLPGASSVTAFFYTVTNAFMWRSVAWIALGVVLLFAGLALWIKSQAL